MWTINETEIKALVERNGYLMRRLVGEVVGSADDKRSTGSQLLEMRGLESTQSLIRKRKLQFLAHCARRGEEDLTWKRMVCEVENGKSKCGTRWKEDWKELRVKSIGGWCNKVKDGGWLASKLGASKKKKKGRGKWIREHSGISSISRAMQKKSLRERLCRALKISSSI